MREFEVKPGWIVQDNNLLACSEHHKRQVFDMLKQQDRAAYFNGGLDKHYLRESDRELFDSIKVGEMWWSCDVRRDVRALERVAEPIRGLQGVRDRETGQLYILNELDAPSRLA